MHLLTTSFVFQPSQVVPIDRANRYDIYLYLRAVDLDPEIYFPLLGGSKVLVHCGCGSVFRRVFTLVRYAYRIPSTSSRTWFGYRTSSYPSSVPDGGKW